MTDSELQSMLDEIDTIMGYLVGAMGVLDSGFMPDITSLERRVADICARIQKAPQETHDKVMQKLVALLESLNECENKMNAFHANRDDKGDA